MMLKVNRHPSSDINKLGFVDNGSTSDFVFKGRCFRNCSLNRLKSPIVFRFHS